MDIEETLRQILTELLEKMAIQFNSIEVSEDEKDLYSINIKSENPSLLIGYHGENIQALQHLLKVLTWRAHGSENNFNILLDVDDYRKRQEENVINLTTRKIETLRKTGRPQTLPAMSPYFRRKIHLHCMGPGFDDIETLSKGEGDHRHIVLKLK